MSDELEHFGVKGMKWGIRKDDSGGSRAPRFTKNQKIAIGAGVVAVGAAATVGILASQGHISSAHVQAASAAVRTAKKSGQKALDEFLNPAANEARRRAQSNAAGQAAIRDLNKTASSMFPNQGSMRTASGRVFTPPAPPRVFTPPAPPRSTERKIQSGVSAANKMAWDTLVRDMDASFARAHEEQSNFARSSGLNPRDNPYTPKTERLRLGK